MINGVEGLFKIDENYTVDKAIINITDQLFAASTKYIESAQTSVVLLGKTWPLDWREHE